LLVLFEPSASFQSNKGNQSKRKKKISIFTFIVIVAVADAVVVAAFMQIENLKFPTKEKNSLKSMCFAMAWLLNWTAAARKMATIEICISKSSYFLGSNLTHFHTVNLKSFEVIFCGLKII